MWWKCKRYNMCVVLFRLSLAVPELWWGPAAAQCPLVPARRAACRRVWGVWRVCWGVGAGPMRVSRCSETSKCERESWKTAKTPSGRERWSLSGTLNLEKRDNGLTLKLECDADQCNVQSVKCILPAFVGNTSSSVSSSWMYDMA